MIQSECTNDYDNDNNNNMKITGIINVNFQINRLLCLSSDIFFFKLFFELDLLADEFC